MVDWVDLQAKCGLSEMQALHVKDYLMSKTSLFMVNADNIENRDVNKPTTPMVPSPTKLWNQKLLKYFHLLLQNCLDFVQLGSRESWLLLCQIASNESDGLSYPLAQAMVAGCYKCLNSSFIPENDFLAEHFGRLSLPWLTREAAEGCPFAQLFLGLFNDFGICTLQDAVKSFELYEASARQGMKWALHNLAMCYDVGSGTEKNVEEAHQLFRRSTASGCPLMTEGFASHLYNHGHVEEAAMEYRVAAVHGSLRAQVALGRCFMDGRGVPQDVHAALFWLQLAAERGDAEAQYEMGACYEDGRGVEADFRAALHWYRLAADQNDSHALCSLAHIYLQPDTNMTDFIEGAHYLALAAGQGDFTAYERLADCYDQGIGVGKNLEVALHWYKLAANNGSSRAQFKYAQYLERGVGMGTDLEDALQWYAIAADQGNDSALDKLHQLEL